MATPVPTHDLDFLATKIREDDEVVRQRLHRMAYEATTHPIRLQYEAEASLNYQYIENDFYTAEELAEMAERGQPPTKRNEIAPIIERIAGQFIQTRQAVTFLGRNTPSDDEIGAIAQDYQRWNDQQNLYEFEEQELAWDGLIGGVGWLKQYIKRNELGQDVECIRSRNPLQIYLDPCSTRYDPNEDAKYLIEAPWMDIEDAIALYPDRESDLRQVMDSGGMGHISLAGAVAPSLKNESYLSSEHLHIYVDQTRKRVRPFEIWYKRKIKIYHVFREDGIVALPVPFDAKTAHSIVAELGDSVYAEPSWVDRMYVGVLLADLVLHHDVSPHRTNRFPYVPFYSGRRKNGAPLPLTSRLVPINEAINKRESKALALMTNQKIVAEKNAIEDPEEAQIENAKPDGYIEVKEGALSGQRVLFRENIELGQAQLAILQEDKDALRRVSGHGNESMGMPSEVRSGIGISRKQIMSGLISMPTQNNLRRTRHLKALLSFDYMKQYLTEEMAFQLTDNPNAPRTVQVTKGHIQAIASRTYDIVITEMKDYETVREQQAEMLLTALPQLAPLGPAFVQLGIQLTDLRDKDGLIKIIQQNSAPPATKPKMSLAMNWQELTPEVQAYIAFTEWQSPELAQAIMQKSGDPAYLARLKAELIQTQVKEGTRATVERGRLDLSALQTATEGRLEMKRFMQERTPQEPEADPSMPMEASPL